MSQNYQRRQQTNVRRQSTGLPVFLVEEEEQGLARRLSTAVNVQRRLSTVSQIYLPHGDEYHSQERVPPAGPEFQQQLILNEVEDSDGNIHQHRLSIIPQSYQPIEEDLVERKNKECRRLVLYIVEPVMIGLILFPILALFWECGWNLVLILLNALNGFPLSLHLDEMTEEEFGDYSSYSLIIPYLIVQVLLLCLYLGQDVIYDFLKERSRVVEILLLKCHILLLASIYIVQWEMIWTIWDQYTPHEWYFELTLSVASLFALIVFIGHLSDLVCAPFLVSYDSIEYCLQFGCSLLTTRQMNKWKIHLINFILYEIVISNLTIMAWRGFYHFLDERLSPDDWTQSAWICLLIGYVLYFPLMYFQSYLEDLNLKYEFWTFVSINFPQFYRNIRHLLAFFSCLFLWRGFWILYDSYVDIFEVYYQTYLFIYLLSFLFLALIQTASSTNGPLSNMEDDNRFFPLYPNCYVSFVVRKVSQLPFFRSESDEQDTKL